MQKHLQLGCSHCNGQQVTVCTLQPVCRGHCNTHAQQLQGSLQPLQIVIAIRVPVLQPGLQCIAKAKAIANDTAAGLQQRLQCRLQSLHPGCNAKRQYQRNHSSRFCSSGAAVAIGFAMVMQRLQMVLQPVCSLSNAVATAKDNTRKTICRCLQLLQCTLQSVKNPRLIAKQFEAEAWGILKSE